VAAIKAVDDHSENKIADDSRSDAESLLSDDSSSSVFGRSPSESSLSGLNKSDSGFLSASPSGFLDFDLNDFDENNYLASS